MRLLPVIILGVACSDYAVVRKKTIDTFTQGEPNSPIDILWVVDDSATMGEEQEQVTAHMDAFADVLLQTAIDFRIGVTTTDVDAQAGLLVGPVLDLDTTDLAVALEAQAAVGVSGSRDEQPLEAALLATSEPALSGANADLFRAGASLQLILLTDEDDHSDDAVDDYLRHLDAFAGEAGYAISAVAGGLPEGCNSAVASAEAAERVLEAVDTTGGDFESICEEDLEPVMERLALSSTGLYDAFYLSTVPSVETLMVKVDGVLMHRRPADGWQYDAGDNAVIFDGLAIPRPAQDVVVEYHDLLNGEQAAE